MPKLNVSQSVGVLANLGVIAGIVFLGVELRQNNDLARATAYQNIGMATAEALRSVSNDPVLAGIIARPLGELDVVERRQLVSWYLSWLRLLETVLLQVEQGLLPENAVERLGYSVWEEYKRDPSFVCLWPGMRSAVGASARTFIESDGLGNVECPATPEPTSNASRP